jgi:hypothetical protein
MGIVGAGELKMADSQTLNVSATILTVRKL